MPRFNGPMCPRGFLTEEERQHMPKVTGPLLKRILPYLAPYWVGFILVFVTILTSAALGLLPSLITGRIVDEALLGDDMKLLIKLQRKGSNSLSLHSFGSWRMRRGTMPCAE